MSEKETGGSVDTKTLVAIAGLAIGLFWVGSQQQQKDRGSDVGNLPATNKQVETNTMAIKSEADIRRSEIEKINKALNSRLDREVLSLNSAINRRELEQIKYIDGLDKKSNDRMNRIDSRLLRDEDMLFQHINTPKSTHLKP